MEGQPHASGRTAYIISIIVHKVDAPTLMEETIEVLEDLVRQGKVAPTLLSNWRLACRERRSRRVAKLEAVQGRAEAHDAGSLS